MNVHGALDYGVGRISIHHVEQGMDDLVTADSQDCRTKDFLGLGVDQNLQVPGVL